MFQSQYECRWVMVNGRGLSATVAFSDGHLGRLTDAAARAAYASEEPTREEADGSVRDAHAAVRDLRRQAGLLRRIVGTYRPGL